MIYLGEMEYRLFLDTLPKEKKILKPITIQKNKVL